MTEPEIAHSVAATAELRSWAASHSGMASPYPRPSFVNRPDLGLWAMTGPASPGEPATEELSTLHPGLSAAELLAAVRSVEPRVTAALLARDGHIACLSAQAGHGFLWRGGTLHRLAPEDERRAGEALGGRSGPVRPGDRYVLCNDGVLHTLGEPALAEILGADEDAPAERLVLAALAAGAIEAVAAITVQVVALAGQAA